MQEELKNFKDKDPYILISVVNTKLRDFNPSLDDLCKEYGIDIKDFLEYISQFGYCYDEEQNQLKRS